MKSKYEKTYSSFSGTDIVASITPPGGKPIVFGELQTISYSIHREKFPVRTLGSINPVGFTYGGRTIAGSLIFTVFDRHIIKQAVSQMFIPGSDSDPYGVSTLDYEDMLQRMVTDEMPPFDVTITFQNEYGQSSTMSILGVTIVDEGQVMSIEDMLTENTMSYMAMDISLMDNNSYTLKG
jgi:hypothetical protein